jgi:hypothetical protein
LNYFENSRRYSQVKAHHYAPASMTPVANFATSFASVVDTGGVDTGGKQICNRWQRYNQGLEGN